MKFKDEARITVSGGHGGAGSVSWRREKYVPLGGPDGGNGGNGGAVILVADPGLNTLIDFSFTPLIKAEDGVNGGGAGCDGRNGEDVVRPVPIGTQVFYKGEMVADLSVAGARWVAARGGVGGKGNRHFKSATNQAPEFAQPGQPGDEYEFTLSLKSVADVGLVGLPNVGKSTLVATLSSARPEVADYPFTTLVPSLGVVMCSGGSRFVIADIPGLIPGAHEGKGLGITFLKHIERTFVLAQLIDVTTKLDGTKQEFLYDGEVDDETLRAAAMEQFDAIDFELRAFSEALGNSERLVIFSKADLPFALRAEALTRAELNERGFTTLAISSPANIGIEELKGELARLVAEIRR